MYNSFMNKFHLSIFLLSATLALFGCSGDGNKSITPKENGMPHAEAAATGQPQIAYVDVDSLMTRLEMCKEAKSRLEAKSQKYASEVQVKEQALQRAYAEFAKKMQSSGYPSQAEYEAAQQRLQQMQTQGAQLQEKYAVELQKEQDAFNESLHDSLQQYIKLLNNEGRYSMILAKSGDNILYANPSMDITDEVVKGMNKRWSKRK